MGAKDLCMQFTVIGSLIVGFAFGLWVISSCEYLKSGRDGDLELGVWRYSLQNPSSSSGRDFDTKGECIQYEGLADDAWVKASQVCAIMAPIFGLILIILVPMTQCCCVIPCSGLVTGLSYTGAQICTALVWLLAGNQICNWTTCEWGDAATGNLIAQIMYLIAAIFHKCMPSPKESAANRKAASAEKKQHEAEDKQKEAEDKAAEAEKKQKEAEDMAAEAEKKASDHAADAAESGDAPKT